MRNYSRSYSTLYKILLRSSKYSKWYEDSQINFPINSTYVSGRDNERICFCDKK